METGLTIVEFDQNKIELIKRTIAKGTSDDQLSLFLHQAQRTGLDPLSKQIHCVLRWNSQQNRHDMSIQVAIDGYRLIADRTGKYAGSDDYLFDEGLTQYEHIVSKRGVPLTATVTVYKLVGGLRVPFTSTTQWDAYFPGDKMGFMWKKMPYLMLGKTAEALALRKAFPAELSGIYVQEEMQQAGYELPVELPRTLPEAREYLQTIVSPTAGLVADLVAGCTDSTQELVLQVTNSLDAVVKSGRTVMADTKLSTEKALAMFDRLTEQKKQESE